MQKVVVNMIKGLTFVALFWLLTCCFSSMSLDIRWAPRWLPCMPFWWPPSLIRSSQSRWRAYPLDLPMWETNPFDWPIKPWKVLENCDTCVWPIIKIWWHSFRLYRFVGGCGIRMLMSVPFSNMRVWTYDSLPTLRPTHPFKSFIPRFVPGSLLPRGMSGNEVGSIPLRPIGVAIWYNYCPFEFISIKSISDDWKKTWRDWNECIWTTCTRTSILWAIWWQTFRIKFTF